MLEIVERVGQGEASLTLTLPFEARQRSRLRVSLSSGEEAALLLPRGTVLRGGDLLRLSDGRCVRVEAAPESVSTAYTDDAQLLARAAYHLGNRHVALEVGQGYVRYLHDHVLDDMARELGLKPVSETSPFEPEGGAYGAGRGHSHSHSHSHGRGHSHSHGHGHSPAHSQAHDHSHGEEHGHHAHGHRHDHGHAHDHSHGHSHDHASPRGGWER